MSQKTTQHAIVAIFKQFEQCNQRHDTSKSLFFDTETTGGSREDQIIEIAFCDSDRHVIIDTLIYTDRPSSPGAFKVHGIYPHELIGKPTFIDIQPGHKLRLHKAEVKCLCKQFADFIGQYSPYFKNNRYFSLSKACLHFGVEHTNAHRAAADALACVTVWDGMMTSHHWDY